jgi:hypothetical protein
MNAGKAHSCGGAYFGSKQAAALNDVINAYESYLAAQEELIECKQMAKEAAGDADMLAMAQEESAGLKETLEALEQRITVLLLPSDPLDERNIMLEVRAGTVRSPLKPPLNSKEPIASRCCCCPRTRWTSATSCWRSARARYADGPTLRAGRRRGGHFLRRLGADVHALRRERGLEGDGDLQDHGGRRRLQGDRDVHHGRKGLLQAQVGGGRAPRSGAQAAPFPKNG